MDITYQVMPIYNTNEHKKNIDIAHFVHNVHSTKILPKLISQCFIIER